MITQNEEVLKEAIETMQYHLMSLREYTYQLQLALTDQQNQRYLHQESCPMQEWHIPLSYSPCAGDLDIVVFIEEGYQQYRQSTPIIEIENFQATLRFDKPQQGYAIVTNLRVNSTIMPVVPFFSPTPVEFKEDPVISVVDSAEPTDPVSAEPTDPATTIGASYERAMKVIK